MNILITGGAGFIGSHLCNMSKGRPDKFVVVDNLACGKKSSIPSHVDFVEDDLLTMDLVALMKERNIEKVVHLAGCCGSVFESRPIIAEANANIIATLKVIEACRITECKKMIFISTGAVYGHAAFLPTRESSKLTPINSYGISNLAAEKYIKLYRDAYDFKYNILRVSNVYGIDPNGREMSVINRFMRLMQAGEVPKIHGTGEQTRDFVYVDDVVEAIFTALDSRKNGTVQIGSGKGTSILQLYREMAKQLGFKEPPQMMFSNIREIPHSWFDISKAKEMLGWQPRTSLAAGIKKMCKCN
ncbi:MAG: NAD-dependent epimerase/dehydratase family protein [Clostridia bacterium]